MSESYACDDTYERRLLRPLSHTFLISKTNAFIINITRNAFGRECKRDWIFRINENLKIDDAVILLLFWLVAPNRQKRIRSLFARLCHIYLLQYIPELYENCLEEIRLSVRYPVPLPSNCQERQVLHETEFNANLLSTFFFLQF